ncbi:MAG: hypothetical protein ABI282_07060, partial [Candidatus Baltobacteraceae bacterium]
MGDAIDPTKSTSLEMNRRAFAGLSIGAVATGITGTAAQAQENYGRPHPPIVREDDPSITIERPQLRRPDGMVGAYAAYPNVIR